MKIFVLDNDADIVGMVIAALTATGHEVRGFTAAADLLAGLVPDVDLVLANAIIEGGDGFVLAEQVAGRVGCSPPRTLLMSTDTHNDRLRAAPVKNVLGIIDQPFAIAEFNRIIGVLQASRDTCPCRIKGIINCPEVRANAERANPEKVGRYCLGAQYADCPDFESVCGIRLREWIAGSQH